MTDGNLSWKDAAIQVLKAAGEPLHYVEIAKQILDGGLKATTGATPADSRCKADCWDMAEVPLPPGLAPPQTGRM